LTVKDAAGSAMMINWTTTNNREVQSQEIALSLDGSQGTFAISKPGCTTPTIDHILLQAIKKPSVQHSAA
jgi:hypothetical protein